TKIPISFQITLDGNEEVHNKIRHTKDGQPTFDKIIDNIKILVSHDMVVNIRLNYTNKSIPTFVDIIEEFKTLSKEENSRISFDFQKVWQDISTVTTSKKLEELRKWFKEERLSVNCSAKFMKSRCYADKCNNLLVNYDGSVYKCSARDFNVENREGVLLTDGTIDWNDKYKYRMSIKYGNNTCHNCSIFPICHGGCSQDKKESAFKEKCIFNYSESDKKNIIIERINELFK
ncbi:MAG: SPASM domain-containing protein, partial [Tannerellaceae bacterium]